MSYAVNPRGQPPPMRSAPTPPSHQQQVTNTRKTLQNLMNLTGHIGNEFEAVANESNQLRTSNDELQKKLDEVAQEYSTIREVLHQMQERQNEKLARREMEIAQLRSKLTGENVSDIVTRLAEERNATNVVLRAVVVDNNSSTASSSATATPAPPAIPTGNDVGNGATSSSTSSSVTPGLRLGTFVDSVSRGSAAPAPGQQQHGVGGGGGSSAPSLPKLLPSIQTNTFKPPSIPPANSNRGATAIRINPIPAASTTMLGTTASSSSAGGTSWVPPGGPVTPGKSAGGAGTATGGVSGGNIPSLGSALVAPGTVGAARGTEEGAAAAQRPPVGITGAFSPSDSVGVGSKRQRPIDISTAAHGGTLSASANKRIQVMDTSNGGRSVNGDDANRTGTTTSAFASKNIQLPPAPAGIPPILPKAPDIPLPPASSMVNKPTSTGAAELAK